MRRVLIAKRLSRLLLLAALAVAAPASAISERSAAHLPAQLATGFSDPWAYGVPDPSTALKDSRAAGASYIRLFVSWSKVAPTRPADPAKPNDPAYQWGDVDRELKAVVGAGMTPIVVLLQEPDWARVRIPNTQKAVANPQALGSFAEAAARRFNGSFAGLPRVRYWQAWNEPNLDIYLKPQRIDDKPFSPLWYQQAVIQIAKGVKAVSPANQVIAGGLTPFKFDDGIAPLEFMRRFFCLDDQLKPSCATKVPVDIWGIHPYTHGGPRRKAANVDNQSLGDLPKMRAILDAAVAAGHTVRRTPLIWATEFGWASDPPTKGGVPLSLLPRWVSEALYVMATNGISNVIWFQLYDRPPQDRYSAGLYFIPNAAGEAVPKSGVLGFRFPFVAYPKGSKTTIWGRTPTSKGGSVTIEVRHGSSWRAAATVTANSFGVFSARLALPRWSQARARFAGQRSAPFSMKAPPEPSITTLF